MSQCEHCRECFFSAELTGCCKDIEIKKLREAIAWVLKELRYRNTDHAKMVKAILGRVLDRQERK